MFNYPVLIAGISNAAYNCEICKHGVFFYSLSDVASQV